MTPFEAIEIAETCDEAHPYYIEAWQFLHDSGLAYTLQGWFGRQAASLINDGVITP